MGADVVIPALQVAAGARIDRGVDERHRLARQYQRLVRRVTNRMHDFDERRGFLPGLCRQRRLGRRALAHAIVNQAAEQRSHDRQPDQQHPAEPRWPLRHGGGL